MTEADRRRFLAVSGAGVAAGAWSIAAPGAASAAARGGAGRELATESVVAYVEDHGSDEVRLLLGDREVVVHDRALVVDILAAAAGGK